MAVLTGISGMQIGDGTGGNIALSINTRVLRILSDSSFSYLTATMKNPNEVKSGSVSYYTPEIIQTENYGAGTTASGKVNAGLTTITIDTRRTAKYDIETFDLTRLENANQIIGMVSMGLAMAILNDLNAHFLAFVTDALKGNLKSQNLAVPDLLDDTGTLTPEKSRTVMNKIQMKVAQFSKLFNKKIMGIKKAEILVILDAIGDINMRNAFWGVLGGKEVVLAEDLVGVQLGNFKYFIDNMINNSIPLGTSFSKDKALDTTNFAGVLLHNEAVAMPLNYNGITMVIDPVTANPRYIAKYQFGIGLVRPDLICGLVKTLPTK
ncbi:MAG: hypothetical protein ACRC63_01215 [Metamycoplasmataceae bacterium]